MKRRLGKQAARTAEAAPGPSTLQGCLRLLSLPCLFAAILTEAAEYLAVLVGMTGAGARGVRSAAGPALTFRSLASWTGASSRFAR